MRYYIIAGEASGDLHGANLIRALARLDAYAEIRYWGGDSMASACTETGVKAEQVKHINALAYMGFIEVGMHLRSIARNIGLCKEDLLRYRPDAVIYIDYPGFNLKIARFAHRHGLHNYYYISPQLWAWKKGRIKTMRQTLDRLYCILPFEERFYAENHFEAACYVGHPLLDAVEQFRRHADKDILSRDRQHIVALLPGSRRQELKRMLPQMARLAHRYPQYRFVVAGMSLLGEALYSSLMPDRPANLTVAYDQTYSLLAQARAAIVCSGTATLEAALFDVPQVVCYRANALSIAIARMVASRRVRYISLVNLIADQPIVTELIQGDMSDRALDRNFEAIVRDCTDRDRILKGYATLRRILGDGGASDRVAQDIIDDLRNRKK
ncbi:MAG: lipid-A-disaccharide synthase [bacterium P3]|nr:MAG: lipid-A-disaccharide synthase [bacterium P201]KWW30465.1 MAG: lipid-A-disaccharide synthase [bacterium P3]KWW41352.1 MAG: lipid-A-disaccharide synthase [bacterium F083]